MKSSHCPAYFAGAPAKNVGLAFLFPWLRCRFCILPPSFYLVPPLPRPARDLCSRILILLPSFMREINHLRWIFSPTPRTPRLGPFANRHIPAYSGTQCRTGILPVPLAGRYQRQLRLANRHNPAHSGIFRHVPVQGLLDIRCRSPLLRSAGEKIVRHNVSTF